GDGHPAQQGADCARQGRRGPGEPRPGAGVADRRRRHHRQGQWQAGMTWVSNILVIVSKRSDMALAVLLMAVIFMMILPLPTALIDFLIALNMMVSILLLMVA